MADGVLLTAVPQTDFNVDEDDPVPAAGAVDMKTASYRERSANLYVDPSFLELKHYTKSHNHEERLRVAAELEARADSPKASSSSSKTKLTPSEEGKSLRAEGCLKVDRHMRKLIHQRASLPRIGACCSDVPEALDKEKKHDKSGGQDDVKALASRQAALKRMDGFHTRLRWRSSMDFSLRRLLTDLDLARDDRLKEFSYQARCEHLDKVYSWYGTHGMKEARKERIGPSVLRYKPDGPVLPGSLRVNWPYQHEQGRRDAESLRHSASAPTLPAVDGVPGAEGGRGSPDASPT